MLDYQRKFYAEPVVSNRYYLNTSLGGRLLLFCKRMVNYRNPVAIDNLDTLNATNPRTGLKFKRIKALNFTRFHLCPQGIDKRDILSRCHIAGEDFADQGICQRWRSIIEGKFAKGVARRKIVAQEINTELDIAPGTRRKYFSTFCTCPIHQ